MLTLHLDYNDFQRVARLCQSIYVGKLPRGFDFKRYLMQLLQPSAPLTALHVQQLSVEEVETLRGEIAEFQDLVA